MDSDSQRQTIEAVEQAFLEGMQGALQGNVLGGCLQLWRDFAAQVDVRRTRKPETWAAALAYTFDRLHFGGLTQEEAAAWFGVSAITVSQKFRQMAEMLDLVLLDPRYLPEARRAAVRREYGALPDDLPLLEAPASYWHFPYELRASDAGNHDAQELVYDGWDALGEGALDRAEERFRAALDRDEWLADAYNGLARVAEARADLKTAETHYRTAYERAREALGSESPNAYYWWGELETRPYMRAREGLGWIHWQAGRYNAALAEYEALLRLNPNDNQGARYLIGPLHQLAGDLDGALDAYRAYDEEYPDDRGDPHHTFCWGLALYQTGDRPKALDHWRRGFFENLYVAPLLLDEAPPKANVWHRTNLEYPDYAEEYIALYGRLWDRTPDAREALRRLWNDPAVRADRDRWLALGRTLNEHAERARQDAPGAQAEWRRLINEQVAIERRSVDAAIQKRVLNA